MFGGDRDFDTICAISTPPGTGGLHVIRVSGNKSLKIVRKFAPFLPEILESHRIYYGTLYRDLDFVEPIDEVLISYFKEGKSFTGEETIEISCHGSSYIATQVVKKAIECGARAADKGEFSYRSFINGKIDLVQAESILSLIESESEKSSKIALRQLKGGLSKELKAIETDILALLARLEISIDFTTEDIEIINKSEIVLRLTKVYDPINTLLKSFRYGSKIQSGYEVVFLGEPNVGKSSLLNSVLLEDRAIVTDIPGTTRDLIQEQIMVKGIKVNLVDTAGVRPSEDKIEQIGIKRTLEVLNRADLIFAVFDCSENRLPQLFKQLPTNLDRVIFIANKLDLISENSESDTIEKLNNYLIQLRYFSKIDDSISFLKDHLIFTVANCNVNESNRVQKQILQVIENNLDTSSFEDEAIVSQTRHYENLQRALDCLLRAQQLLETQFSPEFLAIELKEALIRVQEILGERFDDQILDRVFSEFCIGK